MYSLLWLLSLALILVSGAIADSNVLVINSPQPNQQIQSKSRFPITYTIVGGQAAKPAFDAYYFHTLQANLIWKDRTGGQARLLSVSNSMDASHSPAGLQDKSHSLSWHVPNCRFFSRYPPSQYDYSILFTPVYAPVTNSSPATGPEQPPVSVPITIQVNNGSFPKC
ncbi:hypothetical protein BY458DRAFT_514423 [Sporodiniella umbellata]|nr:hypothetical protein BY458DRAFT_514423 [Sporodiniella umbellata]